MDLIDRQAAIDAIADYLRRVCLAFSDYMTDDESKECATCILQLVPSAQPERKKGRWIKHPEQKNIYGGMYIECSECGEKYVVQYIKDEKFCRNCGAYMGGDT